MKRTYIIEIREDVEDESFTFSLSGSDDSFIYPENLAEMLAEVASTLAEEQYQMQVATRH